MTSLHYTKVQLVTAGKFKKTIICYQTKLKPPNQLTDGRTDLL